MAEVAKAYVTIIPSMQGAQSTIAKEMGDVVDKEGEKAGKGFGSKLVSGAGSVVKAGATAIAAGTAAAAAGVASVAKQSLEAYASYEQLSGGVETLFKDSGSIVMNYANEAYKSAGMSANEYMNTVTSFSASMIASLGGDTAKAAEMSNMAITDMADNANKMGTPLESLQNAYAGFAKGQFNMLDNLKLGYGGTKTEMERLLKDAEKLTGQKYDISSFADITDAIHAIQTEMDITGTTIKEGSTTIEGSIGTMKGAWENLLTAFGTGDGNAVTNAVNNLMDSVIAVANNILPRIAEILPAVMAGLQTLAENLVPQIGPLLEQFMPILLETITNLATSITEMLPALIESIVSLIPELINAFTQGDLINTLIDGIISIGIAITSNMDVILQAAVTLFLALLKGLVQALPKILEGVGTMMKNVINAILKIDWKSVGGDIVNGLIAGIKALGNAFINAIVEMAKAAWSGIKDFFKISSPSKLMKYAGEMIDIGLAEGVEQNQDVVVKASTDVSYALSGSITPKAVSIGSDVNGSANDLARALSQLGIGVKVEIAPDDRALFKVVQEQSKIYKNTTGRSAFA
ncbi:MAG: hypothetical protein HUJ70_08690 [Pseudobutyrivibrio sp.]|nr:hypothetical protein [Pseudobutyrivibrio sp.]